MKCSSVAATAALSAIALALQISHCGAFVSPRHHTGRPAYLTKMSAASSSDSSAWLYGIPNSSWSSPQWNWGYASGTGHDCAAICRRKFASRAAREDLVESLLHPTEKQPPSSFEEVKLVLGLAVQRGRWDGSDGGPGGYGDVLAAMADARRYETDGTEERRMVNFTNDMKLRYRLLNPTKEDMKTMESIDVSNGDLTVAELDVARRKCTGLVLKSMGFIDNGL